MRQALNLLLIIMIGIGGYFAYGYFSRTVCDRPLEYAIGQFDEEFGLSRTDFRSMLEATEAVWEKPLARELFIYSPAAEFKVNLIFDERQQKTLAERNFREKLENNNSSYEALILEYNAAVSAFEARLAQYESDVAYWNSRGGAPRDEYNRLQNEKDELDGQAARLNLLAKKINALAQKFNRDVSAYNDNFAVPQTFDQGEYSGREINIYQFEKEDDLRLVLAHEFGHALNLDHVENPESVMYYLMQKQKTDPVRVTIEDLSALKDECRLE